MIREISTKDSITLLMRARRALQQLDGTVVAEGVGRDIARERAKLTHELLFIAHLLDKAQTMVMDEYFIARGKTSHLLEDPD